MRTFFAKKIVKKCGSNVNVERGAKFTPDIVIGDHSGIGINCELWGDISIGNNVLMGPEVVIYTQNHASERIDITIREQGFEDEKPVVIGNDVWIGRRAMIMPGVKIGNGCIVAAGAVVTRNVDDYTVVGGVPAKVLKSRKRDK